MQIVEIFLFHQVQKKLHKAFKNNSFQNNSHFLKPRANFFRKCIYNH